MNQTVLFAILALGLLLCWQARRIRSAAAARRAARAGYFSSCLSLLTNSTMRIEPDGFPRVAGTYGGRRFDLRVVPDTLIPRKLPTLWVLVTLTEPQPLQASWHLMLRPRGREIFSGFDQLPRLLPPQPGQPADSAVRTDTRLGAPPPFLIEAVERLGADRLKEVVFSPKGLRVTALAEEAHRGRYLIFRDAEMGLAPLPADTLQPLLDALLDLCADLDAATERRCA